MSKLLMRYLNDEDGLEMVEWAICAAVITGLAWSAMRTIENGVGTSLLNLQLIITSL